MARHGAATSRRRRTERRATGDPDLTPRELITEAERGRLATLLAAATGPKPEPTYQDAVQAALVAAGVELEPADPGSTFELTQGSLGMRRFFAEVLGRGLGEMRSAEWPCEADLGDHGETLYAGDRERVFVLEDGTVAHVTVGHGWLNMRAASVSRGDAAAAVGEFSAAYPPLYREADDNAGFVPITFWMNSRFGPTSRLRMIEATDWATVEGNYPAAIRAELSRLVGAFSEGGFEPGKDGQLLLWQGPPGTGKSWVLRALASEWRDWAEFHYITDPDAFFVSEPSYMVDVLLHETYEEYVGSTDGDPEVVTSQRPDGKWKVLILEDTGELLSANAKEQYGQGLSRLLNVVDGMIGQGLRVLALVTTNDELGDLHPAAVRPGRCASQITFDPLSADEAQAWLHHRGAPDDVEGPMTLAELYARVPSSQAAFQMDDGACADCGHDMSLHTNGEGACSMEGCACSEFLAPDEQDDPPAEATVEPRADYPDDPEPEDARDLMAAAFSRGAREALAEIETMVAESFQQCGVFSELAMPDGTTQRFRLEFAPVDDTGPPVGQELVAAAAPVITPAVAQPAVGPKQWQAILAPEGEPTDDGRMFAPGSIGWRDLPLTLSAQIVTKPGHEEAVVCGRIDRIWREGNLLLAEGVFDDGDYGQEIARMVDERVLRGISVDLAIREFEIGHLSDFVDADGNWIASADGDGPVVDPAEVILGDEPAVYVVTDAVIGMVTVVPFPAFADSSISLTAALEWRLTHQGAFVIVEHAAAPVLVEETTEPVVALTASAAGLVPVAPPADWFTNPDLEELTPLVVTAEGHVYGHAAAWDTCHIGIPDVCTTAPSSGAGYAYFHLKEVECDEGERVACGTITLETGHANRSLGRADAAAHYDHTGLAVADVVCGEDDYGIWVAGALRPDVDAEKARALRGAVLSGDWRNVNGSLELVALLAVNVPGFPVTRPKANIVAAGDRMEVVALTAAGVHDGTHVAALVSPDDVERLVALGAAAAGRFADLAARARGES